MAFVHRNTKLIIFLYQTDPSIILLFLKTFSNVENVFLATWTFERHRCRVFPLTKTCEEPCKY